MVTSRSRRGATVEDVELLGGETDVSLEAKEENAAVKHERKVAADVLEHYIRFRCKDEMLSTKDWLELLEITLPKLKGRRDLLEIDKATQLSFVMMLVGSECDPPLASRAISAMLVDHWCDKGPCSFLQKDAMRHSAVIAAELSESRDKESIARQLEAGIEDALAGTGVAELGVFADGCWDKDRDVLFAGGAKSLQEEAAALAKACRNAPSNSKAMSMLEEYLVEKRMNAFEDDFMNWARAQLERLPGTLFDRANFSTTAVSRQPQTPQSVGKSPARVTAPASAGAAAGTSGRADKRRDGEGGGSSGSGRASRGSPRRLDINNSTDGGRVSSRGKEKPVSRAALTLNGHGSGSRGSEKVSRNGTGSGTRNDALSVEDDDASDGRSYGGGGSSGGGGSGRSSGGNDNSCSINNGHAGDKDNRERERTSKRDSAEVSSSDDGDVDEREEDEGGDNDNRRSASSKRRTGPDPDRAPTPRKRRKKSGGGGGGGGVDSSGTTSDEEKAAATEALEEEAEAVAAEMVAARAHPRRGAGKRNQGELFEGDQVFHVTRVLSESESDDSDGNPVTTTRWVPGVVTANRKDGTYDVFLASGGVARVVRRADLYYRRRKGGGGERQGPSRERDAMRPPGCPASVFESADVVPLRRVAGSRAGDVGEWHGGGSFVAGAAPRARAFGRRERGRGPPWPKDVRRSAGGGGGGSGAGEAKNRGRRRGSRVVVVVDSEDESEGETYEEDDEEDEDYTDGGVEDTGRDRRVSSTRSGGGRAATMGNPPTPRPTSLSSGGGGSSNRRGKGKGPARVVSTERKTRNPSVHAAARGLAPPRKLADTAGFRGTNAASPLRPDKQRGSQASSRTGLSFYRAVASEEEDGEFQYISDSSSSSSDEETQAKSGRRAGRPLSRGQEEQRKTHSRRGSGRDGDRTRTSSTGKGTESEESFEGQGEARGAHNAPSDTEIAAHVEEAAGWGGGGASDDSDGSSGSDSDAVSSRKRRPKLKGKGKGGWRSVE